MFVQELEKMIKSPAFYLAIICTVILLMTGSLYQSNLTSEEFSTFDFIFSEDKEELINNSGLYSYDIIVREVKGYFTMFVPIIVAVPFVYVLCGEKKNNNTRFEIYRVGKNRYTLGKGLAACFVGGIITMTGYIIFSVIIIKIFPNGMSEVNMIQNDYLSQNSVVCKFMLKHFSLFGLAIVKFFRMFLYGAFMAVPTYGLSVIIHNRYIILSIPFMIFYLFSKVVEKHGSKILYMLRPDNIANVYSLDKLKLFLIFGGMVIFAFIFYRFCLERKCDCGDI